MTSDELTNTKSDEAGRTLTAPEGTSPAVGRARGATTVDTVPAGASLEELMEAHRAARARRAVAPLGSEAYLKAAEEVGRIEVEIARRGRETSPPTI